MVKEITAFMGPDGTIYTDRREAEAAELVDCTKTDIAKFLAAERAADADGHIGRLILRWEIWKQGDGLPSSKPATSEPQGRIKVEKPVTPPPLVKDANYRRRVAIVGVWPAHQQELQREYKDRLDLTIYSAEDVKQLAGLKNNVKVFMIQQFTGRRHLDAVRSSGHHPMMITGGMGQLKAALNAYATSEA